MSEGLWHAPKGTVRPDFQESKTHQSIEIEYPLMNIEWSDETLRYNSIADFS